MSELPPPPVMPAAPATARAPTPKLNLALAKAQGQMELAVADSVGQIGGGKDKETGQERAVRRYKYANLASAIEAARKPLADNELAILQEVDTSDDGVVVRTLLLHSSGEEREQSIWLPITARTAQAFGSAITYARRYAFCACLNIAGEVDDDGNSASTPMMERHSPRPPPPPQPQQPKADRETARKKMIAEFALIGVTVAAIEARLGHTVETISDGEYGDLRKWYNSLKTAPTPASGEQPQQPVVELDEDEKARREAQRLAEEALAREEAAAKPPTPPVEVVTFAKALSWAELKPLIQACTTKAQLLPFAAKVEALPEPEKTEAKAFYAACKKVLAK